MLVIVFWVAFFFGGGSSNDSFLEGEGVSVYAFDVQGHVTVKTKTAD